MNISETLFRNHEDAEGLYTTIVCITSIVMYYSWSTIKTNMKRGFTLLELLVAIAIIGVLAAIVLSALNEARAKARDAERASSLREIHKAIELYYHENGSYPSTGALTTVYMDPGCKITPQSPDQKTTNWIPGIVPTYIPRLPQDPNPVDQARGVSNSAACYMYASNGTYYILTAWATVESGPQTSTLYSRAGFREASFAEQHYYCNHPNIGNPVSGDYYQYSYTLTNVNCTW